MSRYEAAQDFLLKAHFLGLELAAAIVMLLRQQEPSIPVLGTHAPTMTVPCICGCNEQ